MLKVVIIGEDVVCYVIGVGMMLLFVVLMEIIFIFMLVFVVFVIVVDLKKGIVGVIVLLVIGFIVLV